MKLSTRSRYGLQMMIELAVRADIGKPVLLKEISASQEISEKYLSKLAMYLKNSGLIISERGSKGGYRLGRKASAINVYEIVKVLEGDISIADGGGRVNDRVHAARTLWLELDEAIKDFLTSKTLDILAGLEKDARSSGMYYI